MLRIIPILLAILLISCSKEIVKKDETEIKTSTVLVKPKPIQDSVVAVPSGDTSDWTSTLYSGSTITKNKDTIKVKVKVKKDNSKATVKFDVVPHIQIASKIDTIKKETFYIKDDDTFWTIKNISIILLILVFIILLIKLKQ